MPIYGPLPTDASIRILRFDEAPQFTPTGQETPLSCHVSFIDLEDNEIQPYNCLSYTWGSPFPSISQEATRYNDLAQSNGRPPVILVDGKEIPVTQNLYEAIHSLQKIESRKLQGIWIDAVCIDQRVPEGLVERGKQVAMMDRVYATAEHVLIWLGPASDDDASEIVSALKSLASVSLNTFEIAQMDGKLEIMDAATYHKLGIPIIPRDVWKRIRGLFERTWFQRMWVTQEAALARSLSLHLGSCTLLWEELNRAMMLIKRLGKFFVDIYSSPAGIVERLKDPDNELCITELTSLAWSSIQSIDAFREQLKTLGADRRFVRMRRDVSTSVVATREYAGNPQAWKGFRTHVLHKSRGKKASDPRDKIYAILGLLQGMTDEHGNKIIIPDYSETNSARTLYTNITRRLFQDDASVVWGTAIRVPGIEDRLLRNLRDLPSWVPDLSAPHLPVHLMSSAIFHFNASAHLVGAFIDTNDRFKWGVRGLMVDEVIDLGESYEELKQVYSIRRCLDMLSKIPVNDLVYPEKGEMLSRTLTGGLGLGFQVGREEAKAVFGSYLSLLKAMELYKSQELQARMNLEEFGVLEEGWRPNSNEVFQAYGEMQLLNASTPPSFFLQDLMDRASRYEQNLNRIFSHRRFVLTLGGRVGIGPRSTQAGDEVWIIPPEKTFHILRHNVGSEYELVGDAYIDGVMYGEATSPAREEDLVDVFLV